MKKFYILLVACVFTGAIAEAQEVDARLSEAKSAYSGGNLDNARFALQQALREVDIAIGNEVLTMLPTSIGGLAFNEDEDEVTGMSGGIAGLFVNRTYGDYESGRQASVQLMSDSPLLAGINAILAMPLIGAGDPNQKRIKVNGYKALLQKTDDGEGGVSFEVQVPFGSSLLTFHCEGISSESEIEKLANALPVSDIAALTR